ncbi:MAG: magnesium/cobalt transporter CorA [Deltaproteobacteria bacterium]|nr:magnesium/cobalt transporter CorA [Deltaproteobacteria bacterium]
MVRRLKKRSGKAGLPPGSLIHIGDRLAEKTKITVFDYDEAHLQEKEIKTVGECRQFKDSPTVAWIHIEGIHDTQILEELGAVFGLHPLTLEDILNTDQRPKMEDFCEYIYIVLKTFYNHADENNETTSEQISIILGPTFVISFQEKETDIFKPIRERIRAGKGRLRKSGADYLAYSLIDTIVDNYFTILEHLGEKIEIIEESLVKNPSTQTLQAIQHLKREMIFLRKSVWPLRETISSLERSECQLIQESTGLFLKDIYDHTIQVIDTIETFRDMLSGILDIYLSSISNRMNEIMKVLTIIATIFMPLTFLAGVYGMNFKYMPELEWHWGYFFIWSIMITIVVSMLVYFRKKRWL